jgi:hypothetical protein
MTDCSICFDTISAETGQVILACSHVYHLGCVGKWLQTHDTCPLCRAEPTEKEKIASPVEEEEEDDEEDSYEEDEAEEEETHSMNIPEFNFAAAALRAEDAAFEGARCLFEAAEAGTLVAPQAPAAPLVDVSWRVRRTCYYSDTKLTVEYTEKREEDLRRRYKKNVNHSFTVEVARGGYESA